ERKAKYLSDLEESVKKLTEENTKLKLKVAELELKGSLQPLTGHQQLPPVAACSNCSMERLKNSISANQIASLEAQILQLRSTSASTFSHPSLHQPSNTTDLNRIEAFTPADKANEFNNRIAQVEAELVSLPSLKNKYLVSVLKDLVIKNETETDKVKALHQGKEIARVYNRLYSDCSLMDRVRVVEILAEFQDCMKSTHLQFVLNLCQTNFPYIHLPPRTIDFAILPSELFRRVSVLTSGLKAIPSLRNHYHMIDKVGELWAIAIYDMDPEYFVRCYQYYVKFEELCGNNLDDKTNLKLSIDIAWTSCSNEMDELYARACGMDKDWLQIDGQMRLE
ncbi:hypothetical protein HDU99_004039, partial [Rhizoclosmatium hyalinum]